MDVVYEVEGIAFTWDPRKAKENLRKHGVSFETATEAFFDPFLQVVETQFDADEERTAIIGLSRAWQLLFVIFVLQTAVIRLISARETTRPERKRYEAG